MATRSGHRPWAVVVGCLVACVLVAGSAGPVPASGAAGGPPDRSVRVLQLNLCNSGLAACYTGRSVRRAAAVIRAEVPDVVTLNEVCADDVAALERALAGAARGGAVVSAFGPAVDRRTGEAFRCRSGRPYGIGLLVRLRSPARHSVVGGVYPVQDVRDPEQRAWLCVDAGGAVAAACTTHLDNNSRTVAHAQCRHLLRTEVPALRARSGAAAVVLGGDFNLRSGGSPDLPSCLPAGVARVDDDDVQNVMTTPELAIVSSRPVGMDGTSDHPGLLVELAARTSTT
jgi:endonuclease/exonuclease/phosphatase family metal-dependent hydrolase